MIRDFGKLTAGQEIWVKIEDHSNAARRLNANNIEEWIYKGEITKLGRKYVTVKFGRYEDGKINYFHEEKFNVEDDYRQVWTAGGADYKLYLTKQDILDEIESGKLYDQIKSEFSGYKNKGRFTLDKLRMIKEIIEES
ncbi:MULTISPECIES: hypothetical protein [unclassified Clostridium]|uniref:beta barrel domain-containing protein n=1 Tax=unclassified Clostridium TaxID=2614128 RepID=UPI0025C53555|nr:MULTISPECIES: hypothetical protein [unclassified Clostridium]